SQSLASQFAVLPGAVAGADFVLAAGTVIAAASAAELHRLPFRFVAYTPALLPCDDHAPAIFPFPSRRRSINRALWWSARAMLAPAFRRELNRARAALGLAPVRDLLGHMLSTRPVLAADPPLASMPGRSAIAIEQIPCLHPRGGEPLPEKLERFLAAGPPPVF